MEKTLSAGRVDFGPLVDLLDWDAGEDAKDVGTREPADVVIASLRLSIDRTRNGDRATRVDLNAATRTRVERKHWVGTRGADPGIPAVALPSSTRRFCSSEPTAMGEGWHGGKKGGDRYARWLTWKKLYETTELSGAFFDGLSLIISSSHHALVIKKENVIGSLFLARIH